MPERKIADQLGLPRHAAARWVQAASWTKNNLPLSASKMPDYAAFKSIIETRAQQLGLHQGELPPAPEKAMQWITAKTLATALEMVADRPSHLPVDKKFFDQITAEIGDNAKPLKGLIMSDRTLVMQKNTVLRLPGFQEESQRIAQALMRLGQAEKAQDLLSGVAGRPRSVIAASTLVNVLNDIVSRQRSSLPPWPRDALSWKHDVEPRALTQLIDLHGTLRATPQKLAALPGYGEHAQALSKAFRTLADYNDSLVPLKPPSMGAATFVQTIWQNFDGLMEMASRMATDTSRPRAEEAARATVAPEVVDLLLDERGSPRTALVINRQLRSMTAPLRESVADFLGRFTAQHAGIAQDAPPHANQRPPTRPTIAELAERGAGFKRIDLIRALLAPTRVLIVQPDTTDIGTYKRNRLERIYESNPALVHAPRSYQADRPRQVLRWLSTVLKRQFPESLEVQTYFDKTPPGKIVVAANKHNKALAQFLAAGGLHHLMQGEDIAPHYTTVRPADKGKPAPAPTPRESRHRHKLETRMDPTHPSDDRAAAIFAAIAEGRIEVTKKNRSDLLGRNLAIDMHAERRIKEQQDEQFGAAVALDPDMLAGTMRPCGTCASELELPEHAHRGPFWLSRAGQQDVDIDQLIAKNQHDGVGTSVTRTREDALSFDVDTDSDSDLDASSPRGRA